MHHIQGHTCLGTQHKGFAYGGSAHKPQQIGQQFDSGRIARLAAMKNLFTYDIEDGQMFFIAGFISTYKDGQTPQSRHIHRVGYRCFQKIHTSRIGSLHQGLNQIDRTGGCIDHRGTRLHQGQHALGSQHDIADLGRPRQRRHHHIGMGYSLSQ